MKEKNEIRVLCVEDNPYDRALIRDALEREAEGFVMIEATDRTTFEKLFARGGFDVVLTDFNILGFEGLEVIRVVKERMPGIPVIVVTGTGSEEIAVKALKQGADDYVIKTARHIAQLPHTILQALDAKFTAVRLKEKEANLRAILESVSDGIIVVDKQGVISYANRAAEKIFGASSEQLAGRIFGHPLTDVKPVEIGIPFRPEGPGFAEMEVAETVWEGRDCYVLDIRDITERKQAEEALQKSERELRIRNRMAQVFLTVPDGEIYNEMLGVILEALESDIGGFGYVDENGNLVWTTRTRDIWDNHKEIEKSLASYQDSWVSIWKKPMPVNETLCSNKPVKLPGEHAEIRRLLYVPVIYQGELIGSIQIGNKKTEYCDDDRELLENLADYIAPILHARLQRDREQRDKKKVEAQLVQSQKMEAIGILAGGIAHDFNNLLSVITGYSELALGKLDRKETLYRYIVEIMKAGKKAADLTRQLLAFSRKETSRPEFINLNGIIDEMERMLRRLIREDIHLEVWLYPDLWQVYMDPSQVSQVIMNLVVNAKDAMPDGGRLAIETANVELDSDYFLKHGILDAHPGQYVMFSVSDTGIGMDKDLQEKIFEPFFTTKERGTGTGLGLSTVYGIVKQNNGFIWCYSEPGHGTTMRVYLPRAEESITGSPARSVVENKGVLTGKETVFVVEDNESVRNLVVTFLDGYGYKVLEASGGKEALEIARKFDGKIDLLITDVIMPGMSGKELAERLLAERPDVRVLYMSGHTQNIIMQKGILPSHINYIQKPFSFKALARKVREVIGKR